MVLLVAADTEGMTTTRTVVSIVVGVLGAAHLHALLLQQVGQKHQLGLGVINHQHLLHSHHIAPWGILPNCRTACSNWSLVKGLVRYS